MPMVRWPDGSWLSAESWGKMLKLVIDEQWQPMSGHQLRRDMARRARRWSGTHIDTDGSAEDFFRELDRAQMLSIAEPLPQRGLF